MLLLLCKQLLANFPNVDCSSFCRILNSVVLHCKHKADDERDDCNITVHFFRHHLPSDLMPYSSPTVFISISSSFSKVTTICSFSNWSNTPPASSNEEISTS